MAELCGFECFGSGAVVLLLEQVPACLEQAAAGPEKSSLLSGTLGWAGARKGWRRCVVGVGRAVGAGR